jgi:hypothetical protein
MSAKFAAGVVEKKPEAKNLVTPSLVVKGSF